MSWSFLVLRHANRNIRIKTRSMTFLRRRRRRRRRGRGRRGWSARKDSRPPDPPRSPRPRRRPRRRARPRSQTSNPSTTPRPTSKSLPVCALRSVVSCVSTLIHVMNATAYVMGCETNIRGEQRDFTQMISRAAKSRVVLLPSSTLTSLSDIH